MPLNWQSYRYTSYVCSVCPSLFNVVYSSCLHRWERYLLTLRVVPLKPLPITPFVPTQKPSSILLLVWRWLLRWVWCWAVCSGSYAAQCVVAATYVAVWVIQTTNYQTVVPPMRQQIWSISAWDATEQLSHACLGWVEQVLGGEMRWTPDNLYPVGVQAQRRYGPQKTGTPPESCVCVGGLEPANGIHGHLFSWHADLCNLRTPHLFVAPSHLATLPCVDIVIRLLPWLHVRHTHLVLCAYSCDVNQ